MSLMFAVIVSLVFVVLAFAFLMLGVIVSLMLVGLVFAFLVFGVIVSLVFVGLVLAFDVFTALLARGPLASLFCGVDLIALPRPGPRPGKPPIASEHERKNRRG